MNESITNTSTVFKCEIGDTIFKITIDDTFYSDGKTVKSIRKIPHYHAQYELFILASGKTTLFWDNDRNTVYSDCIIIVPPFLSHYSIRAEGDTYRFLFSFYQKHNVSKSIKTFQFFKRFFSLNSIPLRKKSINQYCHIIRSILDNTEYDRFAVEKIQLLLGLLFYDLLPNGTNKTTNILSNQSYLIKIEETVFNRFTEKITLEQLANSLHLSAKQTSRILKNYYHKTLSELITNKKMTVACEMLTKTDVKTSKIVEDLNFNSESYFFRLFKKYYGCSPSKYRKEHKLKSDSTKTD